MDTKVDYYNVEEYSEANDEFEKYLSTFKIIYEKNPEYSDVSISTITTTFNLCSDINMRVLYNRIELDEEFVYINYEKNNIRGFKKINTIKERAATTDKRRKNKGQSFSNQISIGFRCDNIEHNHKNPISLKIFKNGNVQMTGCKNIAEITNIFTKLTDKIKNINIDYTLNNQIISIPLIRGLVSIETFKYNIEMIIGTFRCSFKINQNSLFRILNAKYTQKELFISFDKDNNPSLRCYPLFMKTINNVYHSIFALNN